MRNLLLLVAAVVCLGVWPSPGRAAGGAEEGSGPRAALLTYDEMVGPHEAEKAQELYYAATTRERALATAFGRIDGALANLRVQAKAKYGADVADAMLRAVKATTTSDIKAAKIKVTGDTASVSYPGNDLPTDMVRVNGEWRISVRGMLRGPDASAKSLREALVKLTKAVDRVADKIEQGKYSGAEEASKELLTAYGEIFKGS